MAIRPENESKLWDEYPVEAGPLLHRPDETPLDEPSKTMPFLIAGVVALMLMVAAFIAIDGGDDRTSLDPAVSENSQTGS